MTPGKNSTRIKGKHEQVFPPFNTKTNLPVPITAQDIEFNELSAQEKIAIAENAFKLLTIDQKEQLFSPLAKKCNAEQLTKSKECYANCYYEKWFEQLKKSADNPDDANEQEKLVHLTTQAYWHLCQDKNIKLSPDVFWKTLRTKVRIQERQDGTVAQNQQVKTPLTDTFTTAENTSQQIIKNDQELAGILRKQTEKQDSYNTTVQPQIAASDFAQLALILPYQVVCDSAIDLTANFAETHLLYYLAENTQHQKQITALNKATAEQNNGTAQNLELVKQLSGQKKSPSILEQLQKLKEKNNGHN